MPYNYSIAILGAIACLLASTAIFVVLTTPLSAQSTDLYLEGAAARALAIGGATTSSPDSPLSAFAYNPAGLAGEDGWRVDGSLTGSWVNGDYANSVSSGNGLARRFGGTLSLGVSWSTGDLALGFSAQPVNAFLADWRYPDVPGVAGARYDGVEQHALFVNYRFGLGGAYRASDRLTIGASAGLVHNRNELDAPYVFQSQAALSGLKVDVDLETETYAPNVNLGILYEAVDDVTIGLSWTSPTSFNSKGDLEGSAAAQFAALGLSDAPAEFRYDAEVETGLPQMVSLGVAVDATETLALFGQVDWVDWAPKFDELTLHLDNGDNATINALVDGDQLTDVSPLGWQSRFVSRLGLTYGFNDPLTGRLGYSHAKSPVPDTTFTPLSGLITEHTLSAGLGWKRGEWGVGLAYQFELPAERSVGVSGLLSGEYSDTRTKVSIHRISLTGRRSF